MLYCVQYRLHLHPVLNKIDDGSFAAIKFDEPSSDRDSPTSDRDNTSGLGRLMQAHGEGGGVPHDNMIAIGTMFSGTYPGGRGVVTTSLSSKRANSE